MRFVYQEVITLTLGLAGLVTLVGCAGNSAGYTQSGEELTPQITLIEGDHQTTAINTPFATPLKIRFNKNGMALPGHVINFYAPETGPSGTFKDWTNTVSVETDASGYATAPIFTANGNAGSVIVRAWNGPYSSEFHLTIQ
ncbi:MAG TPA: hypothetical protein VJ486_11050 [Geothrix sp.]|nr:hypothetical protein [Geothrix sp.]